MTLVIEVGPILSSSLSVSAIAAPGEGGVRVGDHGPGNLLVASVENALENNTPLFNVWIRRL